MTFAYGRSYLFHQDPGRLTVDLDLGPEGRRAGAGRRPGNEYDGARYEGVRLRHDPEASITLFVTFALAESQREDGTLRT